MENNKKSNEKKSNTHLPKDCKLIQESLEKIAEGPQALMKWVKDNYKYIDKFFLNFLRKSKEYAYKNKQENIGNVLSFLEICFEKVLDVSFNNIEELAITTDNFKEYFDKSINLLKEDKPKSALYILLYLNIFLNYHPNLYYKPLILSNIGICYTKLNLLSDALKYFEQALPFFKEDNIQKEKLMSNIGNIYLSKNLLKKAEEYFKNALDISKKREDIEMQINHLINLSLLEVKKKDYKKAIYYQEQACKQALSSNNKEKLKECLVWIVGIKALEKDNK